MPFAIVLWVRWVMRAWRGVSPAVSMRTFRMRNRAMIIVLVAILAFGLMQSVVNAWYAGSEMASAQRLIARNATSLVFPLPLTYAPKLRQVPGVTAVSWAAALTGSRRSDCAW